MSLNLVLEQPQVSVGLVTYTYTIPSGAGGLYHVSFQGTVTSFLGAGDGAGSGFGLGSGKGGGSLGGFALGGGPIGDGASGQGFGSDNSGYQQPPAAGSNALSSPNVASGLSVVVNQGGSPVYTYPTFSPTDTSIEFRYAQVFAAADVITIVISSSAAIDQVANSVKSTCAIGQGA